MSFNDNAIKENAEAWREFFKTPKGKEMLKRAKEAEAFLERLGEELKKRSIEPERPASRNTESDK